MKIRQLSPLVLVSSALLLQACSPVTVSAIQTAVAQTASAQIDIVMPYMKTQVAGGCGDSSPPVGFKVVVGGYVWLDTNGNSLQDPDEPGVPDISAILYQRPINGSNYIIGTAITDSTGHYYFCFQDLIDPGAQFTLFYGYPPGRQVIWVDTDIGSNDEIDSDYDPNTWNSSSFKLSESQIWRDAGIRDQVAADVNTTEAVTAEAQPFITVTVDTNCRSGPGNNYPALAVVEAGESVPVVAIFPGPQYVVVRLPDGRDCWLWLHYTEPLDLSGMGLPEATQPPTPIPTSLPKPTTPTVTPPPPTPTPTVTPPPPTLTPTPTYYIG